MKKALTILGSIFLVIIVIVVVVLVVVSTTSNKLVCKSNEGNITIMYNDETITGYTASKMTFDLDEQKEIANQIGIEEYLNQFENWFKTNTSGTCTR